MIVEGFRAIESKSSERLFFTASSWVLTEPGVPVAGEAATELPDAGGGEGVAGVEEEGSAPGLLLEGCKEALSFIPAGFGLRGYCYSLVWGGGGGEGEAWRCCNDSTRWQALLHLLLLLTREAKRSQAH